MTKAPMPAGRLFVKGQSGNPKGRPKTMHEFQQMFREDESEFYLRLKGIAMNAPPAAAIKAIELGWAYGRGRPKVTAEISGPDGGPIELRTVKELSSGERRKRIAELAAKRGT